jgi:hypothetical protein
MDREQINLQLFLRELQLSRTSLENSSVLFNSRSYVDGTSRFFRDSDRRFAV